MCTTQGCKAVLPSEEVRGVTTVLDQAAPPPPPAPPQRSAGHPPSQARAGATTIYADGGCFSHNPSPRGIYWSAGFMTPKGWEQRRGQDYHRQTNNEAEYLALAEALRAALEHVGPIEVLMDSQLIVNHFNGRWRCKDNKLQPLLLHARDLAERVGQERLTVRWVPRAVIAGKLGH